MSDKPESVVTAADHSDTVPETPAVPQPTVSHSTDERTAPGIGPGAILGGSAATVPSPAFGDGGGDAAPAKAAGGTLAGPPPAAALAASEAPAPSSDDDAKTTPFLQPPPQETATPPGGTGPVEPAPGTAPVPEAMTPQEAEPSTGQPPTAEGKAIAEADAAAARELAAAPRALPGSAIHVNVFGRTEVGLVREHNEDNFLVADLTAGNRSLLPEVRNHDVGGRGSLFVVCDGMGGAAAGEVASQLAVDTIFERLQAAGPPKTGVDLAREIVSAIEEAGSRIFSSARLDRTRRGMGTTVTAAGLLDRELFLAQVGDSRGYLVRGDQIQLVTRDQSLVNQLIEAGQLTAEEAEAFEHSNIILQALGTAAEVSVDVTHVMLRKGDTLIVCSDGLSGLVSADQIKETVQALPEPIECCKRLTEMANTAGGHDNITVIVARFDGEGLALPKPEDRLVFERVALPPVQRPDEDAGRGVTIEDSPAAAADEAVAPSEPESEPLPRGRGVSLVLLALLLIVAASVAYLIFAGIWIPGQPETPPAVTVAVPTPPAPSQSPPPPRSQPEPRTDEAPAMGQTATRTSFHTKIANASLRVDGADRGRFRDGAVKITLEPGRHDVAVIVDGAAVVTKQVTVVAGVDNDFTLEAPGREADAVPAPLAPVAPVPLSGEAEGASKANPTRVRPPGKAPDRGLGGLPHPIRDSAGAGRQTEPPTPDGLPANPFAERKAPGGRRTPESEGGGRGRSGAAPPGQPF